MDDAKLKFEKLYDEYWLGIKKFIYVNARKDASAAEDIFQNTWENAYRYFDTLRDESSAKAWLYRIAHNEAKRYFDKNRGHLSVASLDVSTDEGDYTLLDSIESGEPDFVEAFANSELVAQLLNCLNDEEQRLILMHYAYGIKLKDVADLLGANYNTVKSMTRRGLSKMKEEASRLA